MCLSLSLAVSVMNLSGVGRALQVRRISLDDKAKLKAFSIENDSAGWLQKKLFKKVLLYT